MTFEVQPRDPAAERGKFRDHVSGLDGNFFARTAREFEIAVLRRVHLRNRRLRNRPVSLLGLRIQSLHEQDHGSSNQKDG